MAEPHFADFRVYVHEQIKYIETLEYESHSIEWFLIRYLKRIEKQANPPSSKTQMENAMRALIRFYVDNLEEDSELGDRCQKIYAQYRKIIREQHEVK